MVLLEERYTERQQEGTSAPDSISAPLTSVLPLMHRVSAACFATAATPLICSLQFASNFDFSLEYRMRKSQGILQWI